MPNNYVYNPSMPTAVQPQQMQMQIPQQNIQPLFPQPQGNVYNINSSLEVANVPVGAGISIALCMPENTMFIKAIQNGNPLLYPYKIVPFNQTTPSPAQSEEKEKEEVSLIEQIKDCNSRIQDLEAKLEKLSKKKGDDWNI